MLLIQPKSKTSNVVPFTHPAQTKLLSPIDIPSFAVDDWNSQHQISFYKTVGAETNPDRTINLIGIEIKENSSQEEILADVMITEKDAKEVISNLLAFIRDEDLNEMLEKRADEMRKFLTEQ